MPASDHSIWKIAMVLSVGGVLALLLHVNYAHGFVPKDLVTVAEMGAVLWGALKAKESITKGQQ